MAISYGVRLGLVSELRSFPSVALVARHRSLPEFSFNSGDMLVRDGGQARLSYSLTRLGVTETRLLVGKRLGGVGVTAGLAADRYSYEGAQSATVTQNGLSFSDGTNRWESATRTLRFVGLSYRLGSVDFGAEIGRRGAMRVRQHATNRFGSDDGKALGYLTLGAGVGW